MILLDTNVLSELMALAPSPRVLGWAARNMTDDMLATTVISLSEIEYGLTCMPVGRRREGMLRRFAALSGAGFYSAVLSLDEWAARLAGQLRGQLKMKGLVADPADMMIAAIARLAEAPLATRNGRDFAETGVEIIDPWAA
ncbi:MAG: type II toxin-antitoxin system VapC family toxin [Cellvibrionales bacterium]|nr:type II toxin-antitoxin system VapC family toxin [Cellvibrionales bacterium]